jgi:hypothetical protein
MKRKGSPRYKKWRSYRKGRGGKGGIVAVTKYIKNEKPYEFKISDGAKLQVFARTKEEAIRKAKSWERWLHKTKRGKDTVDFSKGVKKQMANLKWRKLK